MSHTPEQAERVKSIAVELSILEGEVWTAKITEWHSDEIETERGDVLHVEPSNGRIITSAGRPRGIDRNMFNYPRVTSDASRTADAIARDIQRRLLPDAREAWTKCRAEQEKYNAEVKRVQETCARLEKIGFHHSGFSNPGDNRADLWGSDHIRRATIYSDGLINSLELHNLTVEQVEIIASLLTPPKEEVPDDQQQFFELSELTEEQITEMVD